MKTKNMLKGLVLGLALLMTTGAFAANKGSLQVSDTVTVSGKQLAPGNYNVSWEGTGPNVEVKISRGKEVVATIPAHMVDLKVAPNDNAAVINNTDGTRTLSGIRFAGKKFELAVGGETAKNEGNASN